MSYLNDIQKQLEFLQAKQGPLIDALRALDALLAEHRPALPPQLVHYLSQRSYDKALVFVTNALAGEQVADPASLPDTATPPEKCSGRTRRD